MAAKKLHSKVDMLDRLYKPGEGIVVSDTSSDEMYRGTYYPRRPFYNQNFVSIEMKYWLITGTAESDTGKMIVIANMFTEKKSADSVVKILKPFFPAAKIIKADLYLGCMH